MLYILFGKFRQILKSIGMRLGVHIDIQSFVQGTLVYITTSTIF